MHQEINRINTVTEIYLYCIFAASTSLLSFCSPCGWVFIVRLLPLAGLVSVSYFILKQTCELIFVMSNKTSNLDGESDEQVVLVSQSGTVNRIKVQDVPVQSCAGR